MIQPSPLALPTTWDLVSPDYSVDVVPTFEGFASQALQLTAPPKGGRIVDVACGPGTLAVLAARAGYTVDALDFSPQMIEHLRGRIDGLPITPHIGDGQALPFADATFDAGYSMFGLMFFPDRAKGFAELRRVLKPGAKAAVSSWPPMGDVPVMAAMMRAMRETMEKAGMPSQPDRPGALSNADEFRAEMSASFADVEIRTLTSVQAQPSADAQWDLMKRTMAPLVLMQRALGARFAPVDAAVRAAIRSALGEGEARINLPAYLAIGTAR